MNESEPASVTVFAAASLTEPFTVLADNLAADGVLDVATSFGPSSTLVEQVIAGAPADVLVTADERTMQTALDAGVIDGKPEVIAENTLVLIVPAGNPAAVDGLADLGRAEPRVVLCEPRVPCGAVAERVLAKAGVTAAVDTFANDVVQATSKVSMGEADAALVYRTNAMAAGGDVEVIDVPEAAGVVNEYYAAVVTSAANPEGAMELVDQLTGPEGKATLTNAGFGLP